MFTRLDYKFLVYLFLHIINYAVEYMIKSNRVKHWTSNKCLEYTKHFELLHFKNTIVQDPLGLPLLYVRTAWIP